MIGLSEKIKQGKGIRKDIRSGHFRQDCHTRFLLEVIFEHRPEEESKRVSYSNIWGQVRPRPSYSDILGLFDEKEETSELER